MTPDTGPGPAVGAKRSLMEVEMVEEPMTPARIPVGRAAKRRTMGKGEEAGEEKEKERERPGRRGGKRGHGGAGGMAG